MFQVWGFGTKSERPFSTMPRKPLGERTTSILTGWKKGSAEALASEVGRSSALLAGSGLNRELSV